MPDSTPVYDESHTLRRPWGSEPITVECRNSGPWRKKNPPQRLVSVLRTYQQEFVDKVRLKRLEKAVERVLRVCHIPREYNEDAPQDEFKLVEAAERFAELFESLASDPYRGEVPNQLCVKYPVKDLSSANS